MVAEVHASTSKRYVKVEKSVVYFIIYFSMFSPDKKKKIENFSTLTNMSNLT